MLNKLFSMPSASTLLRFVRGIRVTSGMSDSIFNLLEIKSKVLDDQSKCCVIFFDEMSLRQQLCYDRSRDTVDGLVEMPKKQAQPCNEAHIFMVRGLTVNWKQTIAFNFSRNAASPADLDRLLRIIVGKLLAIKLRPVAMVCDQGSSNRSLYRYLGITVDKPYFEVNMHAVRLSVIYDN